MPPKQRNDQARRTEDGGNTAATAAGGKQSDNNNNVESARLGAEEKYKDGPFSLLYNAVHTPGTHVLILCRNQKRIFAQVRAFDRHFNMVLENAREISTEKDAQGNNKMRNLNKLFLRGDSVISVVSMKDQ